MYVLRSPCIGAVSPTPRDENSHDRERGSVQGKNLFEHVDIVAFHGAGSVLQGGRKAEVGSFFINPGCSVPCHVGPCVFPPHPYVDWSVGMMIYFQSYIVAINTA